MIGFCGDVEFTLQSNSFESNFFSKYICDVGLLLREQLKVQ